MSSSLHREIKFSRPGVYRIRVLGKVPEGLWDCFEGKVKHVSVNENGHLISELKFHVRDQVELSGVVDVLFKNGNTLLSVERDDQI